MKRYKSIYFLICLAILLLTGCANKEAKQVLDAVKNNNQTYRDASVNFQIALIRTLKHERMVALENKLEKNRLELKLKLQVSSGKRIFAKLDEQLKLFDIAIEKPIERMEEERKEAIKAGDKQKELELAVQLAATLAFFGKEQINLTNSTRGKLAKIREESNKEVDDAFNELAKKLANNGKQLDIEIEKIEQEIRAFTKSDFNAELKAYNELNRYLSFPISAFKAFFKELVGTEVFQQLQQVSIDNVKIGDFFIDKANNHIDRVEKIMTDKISSTVLKITS
jgi:hypothetical protein